MTCASRQPGFEKITLPTSGAMHPAIECLMCVRHSAPQQSGGALEENHLCQFSSARAVAVPLSRQERERVSTTTFPLLFGYVFLVNAAIGRHHKWREKRLGVLLENFEWKNAYLEIDLEKSIEEKSVIVLRGNNHNAVMERNEYFQGNSRIENAGE